MAEEKNASLRGYSCVWCTEVFIASDLLLYHIHLKHNVYYQQLKQENNYLKQQIAKLKKENADLKNVIISNELEKNNNKKKS